VPHGKFVLCVAYKDYMIYMFCVLHQYKSLYDFLFIPHKENSEVL
jgi:hypothetical protein